MKLKQLESEKKFVFDYYEQRSEMILGGRLFLKDGPYNCASFRIEIKLHNDYPFKPPDGYFLDPIYHPLIGNDGRHCCCCWGFGPDEWRPTRPIVAYINSMIDAMNNLNRRDAHGDADRFLEYNTNYSAFYEKAVRSVLKYGRSRFNLPKEN